MCVCVCLCVIVLPDSPNFPYRRYDRLPPISQFSIESDSDLSETAELIEEYEVFDPSRPRPKVILVIGKKPLQQTKKNTQNKQSAVTVTINSIHSQKNEETLRQNQGQAILYYFPNLMYWISSTHPDSLVNHAFH